MPNYISSSELVTRWEIEPFELLDFFKSGLQPYSKLGVTINCPKIYHQASDLYRKIGDLKYELNIINAFQEKFKNFTRGKRIRLERPLLIAEIACSMHAYLEKYLGKNYSKDLKDKEKPNSILIDLYFPPMTIEQTGGSGPGQGKYPIHINISPSTFNEITNIKSIITKEKQEFSKEFNAIKSADPNFNSWKYFKPPSSDKEMYDLQVDTYLYMFKLDNVSELEQKVSKKDLTGNDVIGKIEVFIESNTEIGFQLPGNPAKILNHQTLGFARTNTEAWRILFRTIQNSPHYFKRDRKFHQRINEKLVDAFNRNLEITFPDNYHLYEQVPNEKNGTLRFKFIIKTDDSDSAELNSKYSRMKEDDLTKLLFDYSQDYLETSDKGFVM